MLSKSHVQQSKHAIRVVTVQPVDTRAAASRDADATLASASASASASAPLAEPIITPLAMSDAPASTAAPGTVRVPAVTLGESAGAGQFANDIADDFGDLLASLSGYAELALECTNDPHMRTVALRRLRELSARGLALTQQLRTYARREPPVLRVIDANEVMDAALAATTDTRSADIDLDLRCNVAPAVVLGDATMLQQLVTALITNAHGAMPAGGTLTAATNFVEVPNDSARTIIVPAGQYIVLTIADTGIGMSAETTSRMFEPFFTTAPRRTYGAGMNLAAVTAIAAQHGWVIGVESKVEVGTAISLYMPLAAEAVSVVHGLDDQSSRDTMPSRSA